MNARKNQGSTIIESVGVSPALVISGQDGRAPSPDLKITKAIVTGNACDSDSGSASVSPALDVSGQDGRAPSPDLKITKAMVTE